VLKWWKRNVENYPVLAKMARDFLAIPLSSVASESTFSTAGMVIDQHRSSLNPETAEGLICSKDWLKEYLSDGDGDNSDEGRKLKTNVIIFLELTLLHDVNGFHLHLIHRLTP
jgi:hypothetical protein